MQGYVNIIIRARGAAQARQAAQYVQTGNAQMAKSALANARSVDKSTAAWQRNGAAMAKSGQNIRALGSQLQWTGRQLSYNFTLPILAAGAAATKFSLDSERAFTRVKKVYGDYNDALAWSQKNQSQWAEGATTAAQNVRITTERELAALQRSFTTLSNLYGINRAEVYEIAGAWAQAGVSGRALAESVNLTMQAMILGEIDATKATEALISIQAQYNFSSQELAVTLAQLNAIENQTGINMTGLITGFQKAAGVAREASVDARHLGAMLAALVPASGSAAQAGNALKTIISRLLSPTQEASQVLEEMGFNLKSVEWQSASAQDRLLLLAKEFKGMNMQQKAVASSVIGSRYQVSKLIVLLNDMTNETGYYNKALKATVDDTYAHQQAVRELNAVLDSSPKKLDMIKTILQNTLADTIQPFIPYLLYFANLIKDLAVWFQNLNPNIQKFVIVCLIALAAIGPLTQLIGAATLALGLFKIGLGFVIGLLSGGLVTGATKATTAVTGFANSVWKSVAFTIAAVRSIGPALAVLGPIGAKAGAVFAAGITAGTRVALLAFTVFVAQAGAILRTLPIIFAVVNREMIARTLALVMSMGAIFRTIPLLFAAAMLGIPKTFKKVAKLDFKGMFRGLVSAVKTPWTMAIAAVVALLIAFRSQIATVWGNIVAYFSDSSNTMVKWIIRAWNALPAGVQNALMAVANIVRTVALEIYEWFSYINPWAHHSPSLVENVTTGMDEVGKQFNRVTRIKTPLMQAYAAIKRFGLATAGFVKSSNAASHAAYRMDLAKNVGPKAVAAFDNMISKLRQLEPILARIQGRLDAQQGVVDGLSGRMDKLNRELDIQQGILGTLTDRYDRWAGKLADAENALSGFAAAPLKGMRAMQDQLHANTMEQNRLRLAMMNLEDAGGSLDEITNKLEGINGLTELLRGRRDELAAGGAGSSILKRYDDEIGKLKTQGDAYTEQTSKLKDMQDQLAKLQRDAERLDLEKALKFDGLLYQIEKASDLTKEMSFDQIMTGINQSKKDMELYGQKAAAAKAEMDKQQAVVDRINNRKDALQLKLDKEEYKLSQIKKRYDEIDAAIQAINGSMGDVASAQSALETAASKGAVKGKKGKGEYVSPGLQNFRDAVAGTKADAGGEGLPMRKNWADQSDAIKDYTDSIVKDIGVSFAGLNPFAALGKKAKEAWGGVKDFFGKATEGLNLGSGLSAIWDGVVTGAKGVWSWIQKIGLFLWKMFGPEIMDTIKIFGDFFADIWTEIGPQVTMVLEALWNGIKRIASNIKPVLLPVLAVLGAGIGLLVKILWNMLNETIRPVFKGIVNILKGAFRIIGGAINLIVGVLTGDWQRAWKGVKDIVMGTLNALWGAIQGVVGPIIGIVWGFIKGIIRVFEYLWDVLFGHSIIPDIINAFHTWFGKLASIVSWVYNTFVVPIINVFKGLYNVAMAVFRTFWAGVKLAWAGLKTAGGWLWNNVLIPILNRVKNLWNLAKAAFGLWWSGVKLAWNTLKGIGAWLWNNVLKPVIDKVRDLRANVMDRFRTWGDGIKGAWAGLRSLGTWVWNNVLKPIADKWRHLYTSIGDWLTKNKAKLVNPLISGVRSAISVVNTLIKGLNKVADVLPGLKWNIGPISAPAYLERGGNIPTRRVGNGFKTAGARAIVGEGKANHPEFVIPTDPTYRNRAVGLLSQAAKKLGVGYPGISTVPGESASKNHRRAQREAQRWGGVPFYKEGGVLGAIGDVVGKGKDLVKGGAEWIKGNVKTLASAPFKPFKKLADAGVANIDWDFGRALAQYAIDKIFGWVTSADQVFEKRANSAGGGPGAARAISFVKKHAGDPYKWGGVGPDGFDCSGLVSAALNRYLNKAPYMRVGTSGSFPWSGLKNGYNPAGFNIGASKNYASSGVGHVAATVGGVNIESAGGVGVRYGKNARGWNDKGFNMHAYKLAKGGIVKASRGGTRAIVGEGGRDEAVLPLPRNWRSGARGSTSTGDTIVQVDKLVLPNIDSGDKADELINNLKALAKD